MGAEPMRLQGESEHFAPQFENEAGRAGAYYRAPEARSLIKAGHRIAAN